MKLARVFPRRTKATPDDRWAFVGEPPLCLTEEPDEVHVSCTFTWDIAEARRLARVWTFRFPRALVRVGGPAFGDAGGDFVAGRYLKTGYVITSRGCPNRCKLCMVPTREGKLRTLPVVDGWNVLDNNFTACPETHIAEVLAMLRRQPRRPIFTGGLEAARFTQPLAREILSVSPDRMFFAFDRDGLIQRQRLHAALHIIRDLTGWRDGTMRHHVSCYCLVGFPGDSVEEAELRIKFLIDESVRVCPMFYRDENFTKRPPQWHDLIGGVMAMGGR